MSEPVLSTHHLCKSFGALKATDDVSIDLRPSEVHAIIGPNGAGKSTLIQQICGGLPPDSGTVFLNGQNVTTQSTQARAKSGLGRTFQVSELASEDTVLENAVLGAMAATSGPWTFWTPALSNKTAVAVAESALGRVGLQDYGQMRCSELSHGQRRQLEVAIALTLSPTAFVMDEPMAGLGAEGSKTMTGFLDGLRDEAPILLVEHDMDAVFALADRISVLVSGQIIATGTIDAIRNNGAVKAAYLGDTA